MNPIVTFVRKVPLIEQIAVGLVIGILLAVFVPAAVPFVSIFGDLFVSALKGVAPVLVFILVMNAMIQRKSGGNTKMKPIVTLYIIGTFAASLVGVCLSFLFPVTLQLSVGNAKLNPPSGIAQVLHTLVMNVVDNPVNALLKANYIGILAWAVIIGLALHKVSNTETRKVFDDLSKHAVAYRTLSLLLKRSPGREAYPGDIFYLHSRLLERACRLNKDYGGGSITALPIVETQAGDISAYIPTNIISITDGQIFLLVDYFNAGQRPAIDSGFSVSRVGSSAQVKAMKEVAKGLKIDLANYNEMLSFSQFGSDLDKETKKVLTHGKILMEVLKQKQYATCSMERQVIELYAVKNGFLDDLETKDVHPFLDGCYSAIKAKHPEIIASLVEKKAFDDATRDALKAAVADFKEGFKA